MKYFEWQKEFLKKALNKRSVILSAPTGAGKTIVALEWAKKHLSNRLIITAPIKALSNQRFRELRSKGIDVGIETGDFKYNKNAHVIVCTQEIYTTKYARIPNQTVIIDEFHYFVTNPDRARAYIDGVVNTHPSTNVLVMSATFGNPDGVKKYLDKLMNRDFTLYHTDQRITELYFQNRIDLEDIHDALVFVFSRNGVISIASDIADTRDQIPYDKIAEIVSVSQQFNIKNVNPVLLKGVGYYYGTMLPKEKLFMEYLFEHRLIDVIVGTDALALGVNLPAENVVFAQLAKYYSGPISKNEFLQISGRAGRLGYFDKGYVYYLDSEFESNEYDTEELFNILVDKPQEPFSVQLNISIRDLLNGRSVEEEAKFVSQYSVPPLSYSETKEKIEFVLEQIEELISSEDLHEEFKKVLGKIYFPEYSLITNFYVAKKLYEDNSIDLEDIISIIFSREPIRSEYYGLLQVKRFINFLPNKWRYKIKNIYKIDEMIVSIDNTSPISREKPDNSMEI